MPNELVREPDENSGPALLEREPVLFPQQRKEAADMVKEKVEEVKNGELLE